MDHIIIKGIYLMQSNYDLLKVKLENDTERGLLDTYKNYYIDDINNIVTRKQYPLIQPYEIYDDSQDEFYKTEREVPNFWIIKTRLLRWTFTELKTSALFASIQSLIITSWVIHIEGYEWRDKKNIILFQAFHKASMYIWSSYWDSKIAFALSWRGWIFKPINENNILNLRKSIDAVYLDDNKLYVFNRGKYDIIFSFREELRKNIWTIFTDCFLSKTDIFDFTPDDMPVLIESIKDSSIICKKIYMVYSKQVLDHFVMADFHQHLANEWIPSMVNSTWKITLQKAWLELLLDALNHNLFTSWNGQKFKSKAKVTR
jgi:hypothetical protein